MRRWPLVPLSLLAALNFYIGARLLPDLGDGRLSWIAGVGVLLLLMTLIPSGLFASRARAATPRAVLVWGGLLAAGWFSSLFVLTLLRDAALLLTTLAGWSTSALHRPGALVVVLLSLAFSAVGFFNARKLAGVVDVTIPIANLPAQLHGFTIAQISDIHVGPTIGHDYLGLIVDAVNRLQPDLIAVTGDVVDGSVQQLSSHTEALSRLEARHGTFVVTGNHEYYSHAPSWIAEFRRLGLQVLLNEHVVLNHLGHSVLVAGVTDFSAHHFIPGHRSDPQRAIDGAPENAGIRILLAHQPRSASAAAAAGFDLQLSGHTHGGQFFPWNFFVRLQQPFTAGLNRVRQLWVYTSRGTGYWGPPKRLGAPSEITRLRLVCA